MAETSQERVLRFGADRSKYLEKVNRWAIIVGISKYQYDELDLKYADNDANELYDLIRTPSGGAFEEQRIVKLVNKDATTSKITAALRSFLKKPDPEDIVLIFFACHGAPDPERTDVVYLLTHDTDPKDIAGTALPMREIDSALKDNLRAERVVIIADTCHSAAVGGKIGRRGIVDTAVVNRYLQDLSESKAGLALLTSAQSNESSLEGERWGGGHGVFTHFLLEGMRGKADRNPKNGTVTVGELFEYVRDEVKRATNDAQHPVIGTNQFDPNLPIAVTGGISIDEHLQLGICLNQLGRLLNEPARFEFAHTQLREAIAIADRFREKLPEALLQIGIAETAVGDHESAVVSLRQAIKDDKQRTFPEIYLHLGVTLARLDKRKEAAAALNEFIKLRPNDARTRFVEQFAARLAEPKASGQTYALLIGISNYKMPSLQLRGPENDIPAMKDLLVDHYGIAEGNILSLIDAEATQQAIVAALEQFKVQANGQDRVLVYFSGHAFHGNEAENYLLPFDYGDANPRTLTAQQLHDLLNGIPSHLTTVIIDSHATTKFVELAKREGRYRLLLGTSPDQMAYESYSEGLPMGAFTSVLVQQLKQNPANAPLKRIAEAVAKITAALSNPQQPIFVGDMKVGLLSESGGIDGFLDAYEFSLRRNYDALSTEDIRDGYAKVRELESSFLQLDLSCGIAFLEKGQFPEALDALNLAAGEHVEQVPETFLSLGIAHLHNQNYEAAFKNLGEFARLNADAQKQIDTAMRTVSDLTNQRKHALLVGIDQYPIGIAALRGAINDVQLVKKLLIERCNFADEDVQLITDKQATQGAIVAAFDELLLKAQHGPAIFYFAGYGSVAQNGEPTIVPADWGTVAYPNDIALRDLARKSQTKESNLIAVIDAGWQENVRLPYGDAWGSRFIPGQLGGRPTTRGISLGLEQISPRNRLEWEPDEEWNAQRKQVSDHARTFGIGRLSIYHVSIQSAFGNQRGIGGEPVAEAEFPSESGFEKKIHGVLTHALMAALREEKTPCRTYDEWAAAAASRLKWLQPFVVGKNRSEAIFSAPVQEQEVHERVYTRFRQQPIRQSIQLLNRLIEQAGGKHALGHLNLGIAYAALGEYPESLKALEKAIEESGDSPIPEAHYYRGRVLYEMDKELDLAVSELRKAVEVDPENVPANYYFAHAVRRRMERKTLVEAREAFEYYLANGAPLGKREEVEEVLRRWSNHETRTHTESASGEDVPFTA